MDRTDDLWTAIRRVLPSADEVAVAVAAELGEPLDAVRPSVLIGTIALNGQLGPEAAASAAIAAELGRLESAQGSAAAGSSPSPWPRSTTSWPTPARSRLLVHSTSRRSWRSSAPRGRSRRGPIAHWSSCCTATRSPDA